MATELRIKTCSNQMYFAMRCNCSLPNTQCAYLAFVYMHITVNIHQYFLLNGLQQLTICQIMKYALCVSEKYHTGDAHCKLFVSYHNVAYLYGQADVPFPSLPSITSSSNGHCVVLMQHKAECSLRHCVDHSSVYFVHFHLQASFCIYLTYSSKILKTVNQ